MGRLLFVVSRWYWYLIVVRDIHNLCGRCHRAGTE